MNVLPGDVLGIIDKYVNYNNAVENLFIQLIRFYIKQTGGDYLTRQEFEEEWYNSWRNLTQFFRKYKLNFDVYYEKNKVNIDYSNRVLIDDNIIYQFIIFILNHLGLDTETIDDLNLVLKKNNSPYRVIGMGRRGHRYFEITKTINIS